MNDTQMTKILYCTLILVTTTMFLWTVNYINATNNLEIPTAITAFNA